MLIELRQAVRRLRRSPGFSLTAIVSLALGLGTGAAAFSVVDAVRFRALPFKDGDRLVVVSESSTDRVAGCLGGCDVGYETFATVLKTHPFTTVDLVAGYTSGAKALNLGTEPIVVLGGVASQSLFTMLGTEPEMGRVFTAEDDRLGVELVTVISHDLWVNHLGRDPGVLGRSIKLSDSRYTVIGVMPAGFNHEVSSLFWLPAVPTLDPSTKPSIRALTVVARLRPGATVAQFGAELAAIDPAALRGSRPPAAPPVRLEALPLRSRYVAATESHDLIFAAVVACIILIAAANLANMTLVRALHQQREFAIRSALGADHRRLTRQLMAEQLIVVAVATAAGLVFAGWLLGVLATVEALQSLRPAGMIYRIDGRTIGFAVALAVVFVTGLGLVPARLARRTDLQKLLRQGGAQLPGGRLGIRVQRVFVVAQVSAAVVLAVGAGLLAKTVLRLGRLDLGFDAASVIEGSPSFPHPWRVKEKFVPVTGQIARDLAALPGAAAVGIRAAAPLGPRGAAPQLTLDGSATPLPAALVPPAGWAVDTGYFRAVGVTLAAGRGFGREDTEASPPAVIINEWAARRWWPGQAALGRFVQVDTAPGLPLRLEVVGVVRDNKAAEPNLLLSSDGPELYRPLAQAPSAFPTFLVRARGPTAPLLKPIRETLARLVPDRPLTATPMTARIDQQLAGVRTNAYQVLGFALVGLALAGLGVYGVLAFAVGRRTQEIGIRGALGAGAGQIRRMVLRDTAVLAGTGVAIGLPLAAVAARSLGGLLHGTDPADPAVMAGVGAVALAAALAAGSIPARRATQVDPLVALRSD